MIETCLFYLHFAILFIFGTILSFAFAQIELNKKNCVAIGCLSIVSGFLQIFFFFNYGEEVVWRIYPFITHLPILLLQCIYFKKKFSTSLSALTSAYLCCQPANWIGELMTIFSNEAIINISIQIIIFIASGLYIYQFSGSIAEIYNKETKTILIFGIVPIVYYIYDYSVAVYTNYWIINNRVVIEFLPLFLCIVYFIFCLVYHHQYELKADAQRNEQIMHVIFAQQDKENKSIKENEQKIRLLRHDLRLLLNNIKVSIDANDRENALKLISSYVKEIDSTTIQKYCSNDIINYIFSSYADKCEKNNIIFDVKINIDEIIYDELLLSSLLSNIFDNAINAQMGLNKYQRKIYVLMKYSNGKFLLSVKNPYSIKPIFENNKPVSKEKDHGYGTQSIQYITKRLGGTCQFTLQDNFFCVRIII